MAIDVAGLMTALASRRPIFHSEADFQHALAWDLHTRLPELGIRLELPIEVSGKVLHLDLWLSGPGHSVAIELKYKTRGLSVKLDEERFSLKDQSAQDLGRYDFLKDVRRIEEIAQSRPGLEGWAILLTNDSSYWKRSSDSSTVDSAFRLHNGRSIAGTLEWGSNAAPGTIRSREDPITLAGTYQVLWHDYSAASSASYGAFRYLAFSSR